MSEKKESPNPLRRFVDLAVEATGIDKSHICSKCGYILSVERIEYNISNVGMKFYRCENCKTTLLLQNKLTNEENDYNKR